MERDASEADTEHSRFVQTDAFEFATVAAMSAGDDQVLLAGDDGQVVSIDDQGRRVVAERPDVVDIAVADRGYVLTTTTLEAFSPAGSRVWSADIVDAERVDADPVTDDVYVRLEGGELIRFEGRTGIEQGRFAQPHADVAEKPATVAYGGKLAIASWTFLTVLSQEGDVITEVTLDGAATDLAVIDDVVVVSLKDGRLVGYDGDNVVFHLDTEVEWLATAASTTLICRLDGQTGVVDTEGAFHLLEGINSVPVGATCASTLACAYGDGTVTVYQTVDADGETVEVEIQTATITPSEGVVGLEFRNEGETTTEVTATVDAEGATLAPDTISVTVGPGETRQRRLTVRELDPEADEVCVTVHCDGDTTTATIGVREERRELATDVSLQSVERGYLTTAVTVTNEGELPVHRVTVGDEPVGTVAPETSQVVELDVELPSGSIPVQGEGVEPTSVDAAVPSTPTDIDLTVGPNGFLVVSLDNETPVDVVDDLGVRGGHRANDRLEFEVKIPARGAVRYAIPVLEAGERSVLVETSAGRLSRELSLPRTPGFAIDTGQQHPSKPESPASAPDDPSGSFVQESPVAAPLTMERELSVSTPVRGECFVERLAIENESGDPVTFELLTDDGNYRQQLQLQGNDRAVGHRTHVAFSEEITLPAVRLDGDWGPSVVEEPSDYAVDDGSLVPLISWSGTSADGTLRYEFRAREAWEVASIEFGDEFDLSVEVSLASGETSRGEVDLPHLPDEKVVPITVHGCVRGESRTIRTLAPHGSLVDWQESLLDEVTVDVDLEWSQHRDEGLLALSLRNTSEIPLENLQIEAEGDALQEWTRPHQIERLAAGEAGAYTADLDSVGANQQLTVKFRLTTPEEPPREFTVRAAADGSGNVTGETLSIEESEESELKFPDHVSTSYH